MPEKKKPSSSAKPASRSRSGSASRADKPARTTKRTSPARRRRPAEEPAVDELQLVSDDAVTPPAGDAEIGAATVVAAGETEASAPAAETREVAVVGQTAGTDTLTVEAPPALDGEPGEIVQYREDIPIAIVSALLAISPFLPWYKLRTFGGGEATASGFETGTWGPAIALLGLLSLVLAVARRMKARIGVPYPDSTIHEAVGWIALVAAVVKFRAVPQGPNGLPRMGGTWGVYVAMGSAFVLAFLAGRMSSGSPFVQVPGWSKGRAGAIGMALLALVIGGSVAFGLMNNVDINALQSGVSSSGQQAGKPTTNPNVLRGKFPQCAAKFPKPTDAKPKDAVEQRGQSPCVFTYSSAQTPDQLLTFYKDALKKAGYTFQVIPARTTAAGQAITFTAPQCGSMSMQRAQGQKESSVIVAVGGPCPSLPSSPQPTSS